MSMILLELAVILLLILANGVFSMSELAVISSRKTRLQRRAQAGDQGAVLALQLANDPNRFLPTVQIGITLVGTLAGAFSGATLAENLDAWLERTNLVEPYRAALALSIVVVLVTYLTLVLGELLPKRVALSHPERIAAFMSRPLVLLSRIMQPAVHILGGSTAAAFRLLGIKPSTEPPITEEEIEALLRQGTDAGVFEPSERDLVKRVFRLGDRSAGELMTTRSDVVWIDVADPPFQIRQKIAASPHSRFPVCEENLDNVLGVIQVKDLLVQGFRGLPFDLRGLLRMPLFLYEGTPGYRVLELFKTSGVHVGIVLDEFGSVEGIITLNDILEALVGDLPDAGASDEPMVARRSDGSWLVDGRMPLHEAQEALDLPPFPEGEYHTLAGFVIAQLGRIPKVTDFFTWGGHRFEVVDMDGHRIDKILIEPASSEPPVDFGA